MNDALGIVGTGLVARGLADPAADVIGPPIVLARTEDAARRATGALAGRATVTTRPTDLEGCAVVVEAVIEDLRTKCALLDRLGSVLPDDTVLMTTTSSLSINALASASGRPASFAGLHVFTPVRAMPLVELVFPEHASRRTRAEAFGLCAALGKTAVEVPDVPGFIVNRVLFPFLFDAVRVLDLDGVTPESVDTCVRLGASHPMGPLALLDFVGLDVAVAIARELDLAVPPRVVELVADGKLGRKAGAGFYEYG
jgi:3-hydroxybutyryl-CoA dehydrogenase